MLGGPRVWMLLQYVILFSLFSLCRILKGALTEKKKKKLENPELDFSGFKRCALMKLKFVAAIIGASFH